VMATFWPRAQCDGGGRGGLLVGEAERGMDRMGCEERHPCACSGLRQCSARRWSSARQSVPDGGAERGAWVQRAGGADGRRCPLVAAVGGRVPFAVFGALVIAGMLVLFYDEEAKESASSKYRVRVAASLLKRLRVSLRLAQVQPSMPGPLEKRTSSSPD
jgi:hypothetical protein